MWTGQTQIQPGWAVFRGTAGDHARHRHHAVQVAVPVHGQIELWAERPGALTAAGAVIAADCLHQIASGPDAVILLYVDRESHLGRALDDWCAGSARPLSSRQGRSLVALLIDPGTVDVRTVDQANSVILASASSGVPPAFRDERIAISIAGLPGALPESLTLATLAKRAGLSSSRYGHLFRAHAGIPLRPYLRWRRLQQALSEVARGANLTQAAHAAGFADSAHLSRSFRRTFGISPNVLLHPSLKLDAGVS